MSQSPDAGDLARMKEQLAATEERARALSAELESLSYAVSHDLRAPLRAINGFSQALLEDYGSTLPPDGQSLLVRVRDNTKRMAQMLDGLLALSRLGRKSLDVGPVDLTSLAQAVVQKQRQADPGRDVDVVIGSLPAVTGDAALLHQALSNLVDNAFKFTRRTARAHVEIGSRAEGGETVCYVRDNGAGFDMKYAKKLFGVFQRLHPEADFEGTPWGWRWCSESCIGTVDVYGPRRRWTRARRSTSLSASRRRDPLAVEPRAVRSIWALPVSLRAPRA